MTSLDFVVYADGDQWAAFRHGPAADAEAERLRRAGHVNVHVENIAAPSAPSAAEEAVYQRGFRAGVLYWTDRPDLVQMPARKRQWLRGMPQAYQDGFTAGAATVTD